jgi:hypothetical protein
VRIIDDEHDSRGIVTSQEQAADGTDHLMARERSIKRWRGRSQHRELS